MSSRLLHLTRLTLHCSQVNRGFEQVILELVPDIIVEKEEEEEGDSYYQLIDQYEQCDTIPYTPVADNSMRRCSTFTSPNKNEL